MSHTQPVLRQLLCAIATTVIATQSLAFEHFITRNGHQLKNGDANFRFAGIHAPELHRIENDAKGKCAADPRGWGQYFQWPTADEQENWIKALTRTGHKAMRVYVLSVATPWDTACERETHILPPLEQGGMPRLNDTAMLHYDRMIALADEHKLRLILPFIDHWDWWGGRKQLAAFYGETEDHFYDTSSQTYAAYQHIIRQVITRKNTITGRYYFEEKAIMAWETGNELKGSTEAFVTKTAAHIKTLAPQQLVVDGTYLAINDFALNDPNIDIISNHYYTVNGNNSPEQVRKDLQVIGGKKVYMIGEFGLKDASDLNDIMQQAIHADVNGAKTAGAFIWGFRGHRHNGGFYWHKEYSGHYSYHLPGFPDGDSNEEQAVIDIVRNAQAQMNGQKTATALPAPEAPILRSVFKDGTISWMGSPVGRFYRIERAKKNPNRWAFWQRWYNWDTIATNLSDGKNGFNPETDKLYQDINLSQGSYRYRIYASNEAGESTASNIITLVKP